MILPWFGALERDDFVPKSESRSKLLNQSKIQISGDSTRNHLALAAGTQSLAGAITRGIARPSDAPPRRPWKGVPALAHPTAAIPLRRTRDDVEKPCIKRRDCL